MNRNTLIVIIMALCPHCLTAQEPTDSTRQGAMLNTALVTAKRYTSHLRTSPTGTITLSTQLLEELPKIMGNADPVHYAQMLPGVQTNGEYRSGLNIEGCESSHNLLSIDGVHIYNVNHLLGFFSTFNASHFTTMQVARSIESVASANRLGGELSMTSLSEPVDTVSGELTTGLISSQGTIRLPLGKRTSLVLSGRASYLNLLYGTWLRMDDMQMRYSFLDANATLVHAIDRRNTLSLDFYTGYDHASYSDGLNDYKMQARWGNYVGALHWKYNNADRELQADNTFFATSYYNKLGLSIVNISMRIPSGITDYGYRGKVQWRGLTAGADVTLHDIHPQSVYSESSYNMTDGAEPSYRTHEASIYAQYEQRITSWLNASGGARGSIYHSQRGIFHSLDPTATLSHNGEALGLRLTYSLRHQYIFQTGFTDMGLPTEFWLSSSLDHRPQYAHCLNLSASYRLKGGSYVFMADVFLKRLHHQIENNGSFLDILNAEYHADKSLLHGKGNNAGFSLMAHKCTGRLTGWVSYTYTHARRTFLELLGHSYHASHERPHELNLVATYALRRHWSFGGTFVVASGTPFTVPESFLVLNSAVVPLFGQYNAARLKPYVRLDLSANYKWNTHRGNENGINLSLYNASCNANELFYYTHKTEFDTFRLTPVSLVVRVLPSVSYFLKF